MYATNEMLPIRMYLGGLLIYHRGQKMTMLPFEFKYQAPPRGPKAKDCKEMKESTEVIVEVLNSFPILGLSTAIVGC